MIRLPLNGGAFAKRVADLFCRRRTAAKVLKEWTTPAGLKARVEDREGILWGLVQDSGSPCAAAKAASGMDLASVMYASAPMR